MLPKPNVIFKSWITVIFLHNVKPLKKNCTKFDFQSQLVIYTI